jgi:hypothetical protein
LIRVERDPAFWEAVAAHPALAEMPLGLPPGTVGAIAARDDVLPLAAEHGGFFFRKTEPLGFVAELHSLFSPEGWGREALTAGTEAIHLVWLCGYQAVITLEVQANARSRPPRTFGFSCCGDWRETPHGNLRMWMLTRAAWEASPVAKRRNNQCP